MCTRIIDVLHVRPGQTPNPSVLWTQAACKTGSLLLVLCRRNLQSAAAACRRFGWIGFWSQLTLSVVSAIILLFSVAFTSQVGCSVLHAVSCSSSCWWSILGVSSMSGSMGDSRHFPYCPPQSRKQHPLVLNCSATMPFL